MTRRSFSALLLALVLCATLVFSLISCGGTVTTTDDPAGSTEAPGTDAPGTDAPGTETPGTDAPGTDAPGTSGGDGPDIPVVTDTKMNIKFFKVGKANATLIRTPDANILIDCGEEEDEDQNGKQDDGEKILEFLAEKGVTKLDLVIVSQFNKNHYGSIPTILEGVTVDKVIEPAYAKTGSTYEAYKAAIAKWGKTADKISTTTDLTYGKLSLTVYPAAKVTTAASADEFNSLAVSVTYDNCSVLLASDIFSTRVSDLITALNGKKFDILQVPNHGAYSDTVKTLVEAVDPDYAVIFASDNNPEDGRVNTILSDAEVTTFVTKGGSVEAKYENSTLTVKQ